jgi:hypothetical protein
LTPLKRNTLARTAALEPDMDGRWGGHIESMMETESRYPPHPVEPPDRFRRWQLWAVAGVAVVALAAWLVVVLAR